jgi:hypothetical protein
LKAPAPALLGAAALLVACRPGGPCDDADRPSVGACLTPDGGWTVLPDGVQRELAGAVTEVDTEAPPCVALLGEGDESRSLRFEVAGEGWTLTLHGPDLPAVADVGEPIELAWELVPRFQLNPPAGRLELRSAGELRAWIGDEFDAAAWTLPEELGAVRDGASCSVRDPCELVVHHDLALQWDGASFAVPYGASASVGPGVAVNADQRLVYGSATCADGSSDRALAGWFRRR